MLPPELCDLRAHIPQTHVLDAVLATIPAQTCALQLVEYKIHVGPLDMVSRRAAPGRSALRLDNTAPLPFFRNPAWRGVDRALARLASGRTLRFRVEIGGMVSPRARAAYAPQDMFDDSMGMDSLMQKWGRDMFVAFGKMPRAEIKVSAGLGPKGGIHVQ